MIKKKLIKNTELEEFLKIKYPELSEKDRKEIAAEKLDLQTDPVKHIHELEDGPKKCFVWDVDMTDPQIREFARNLESAFVKKYSRDPQALHFIRNDINSIKELDPVTVREQVEPWLNESGKE